MGYRLQGEPIRLPEYALASAGVPFGAVQLPPSGQPIVLLKDRQTMGGYPVVACLSRLSAWALAQMRPGESVIFKPIELALAQARLAAFYQMFA
jgi:allophanate hydrolase subunit 2